ncbi:FAD-dependent oxidoreductase [Demequina capsici]|uniref:FAD-dependent oxidoreductase n=1 Tax=Demequina capsici TaxID=3075620 RepID=A0AA96JB63_9MICO|nr:FAD-dependent oxidoreductase [Demequina sp. OYTSA14]WNM25441.1 FAD-dependent oxidoreductase [Demequina sp. OYTSA14]
MRRIVVIGDGMVGSRFAELLVEADLGAHVTLLGKEPVPAYNRVLLSSVVAGTKSADLLRIAKEHPRIMRRTGVSAVTVDRDLMTVVDSTGRTHPYAALVLATGSAARVPAVQGVADAHGLVDGVFVLKDMADADGIVTAAGRARRAVVLGAGVLGLEVATGLARRGIAVRLVHIADRLMERQLGWEASAVAESSLRRLGIESHTGASLARVHTTRGRVTSVRLEDGSELLTDMVVMCAGTIPETTLARAAGLACERGVIVDDSLATTDPHIWAIGDCAQPPGGARGLVAQGWQQASTVVGVLTGSAPGASDAVPTSDVVRVKADGMAMVAMGVCGDFDRSDPRYRVLSLKDPEGGRYIEVVVSGGQLVGATCIGDGDVAATLSALYTRRLPVPPDPAQLMIRALAGGGAAAATRDPADLKDDDKVCNCNTVTAGRIREALADGCETVKDVAGRTRATTGCGDCTALVEGLIACHRAAGANPTNPAAPVAVTQGA